MRTDDEIFSETATLMFADVVESAPLVEKNERDAVIRIRQLLQDLTTRVVANHEGRLLERRGDGLLVSFANPRRAVACALALQSATNEFNARSPLAADDAEAMTLPLRIGLHHADVLSDGEAYYGRGINMAARVAALAAPGQIIVSDSVADELCDQVDCVVQDLGVCYVKHGMQSIHAFRVSPRSATIQDWPEVVASQAPTITRVAVLAFACAGNFDANAATIADLVGDGLVHQMSRADSLAVISWSSSRSLDESCGALQDRCRTLRAQWCVTGRIYVSGESVLITAEVVSPNDDVVLWSARVRTSIADLLVSNPEALSEIASGVVQAVVEAETARVSRHSLPNIESHSMLTGAIGLMYRAGREKFDRSRAALEHLLDRHPRMDGVRPWIAQWYVLRSTRGLTTDRATDAQIALSHTETALDRLPNDSFSMAMQGFVHCHLTRRMDVAEDNLQRAIETNPSESLAWLFRSTTQSLLGESRNALTCAQRAISLSPIDPLKHYYFGLASSAAFIAGELDLSIRYAEESIRLNSAHAMSYRTLLMALAEADQLERAPAIRRRLLQLQPGLTVNGYVAGHLHGREVARRCGEALRVAGIPLS